MPVTCTMHTVLTLSALTIYCSLLLLLSQCTQWSLSKSHGSPIQDIPRQPLFGMRRKYAVHRTVWALLSVDPCAPVSFPFITTFSPVAALYSFLIWVSFSPPEPSFPRAVVPFTNILILQVPVRMSHLWTSFQRKEAWNSSSPARIPYAILFLYFSAGISIYLFGFCSYKFFCLTLREQTSVLFTVLIPVPHVTCGTCLVLSVDIESWWCCELKVCHPGFRAQHWGGQYWYQW